jgi:hypothetical protein
VSIGLLLSEQALRFPNGDRATAGVGIPRFDGDRLDAHTAGQSLQHGSDADDFNQSALRHEHECFYGHAGGQLRDFAERLEHDVRGPEFSGHLGPAADSVSRRQYELACRFNDDQRRRRFVQWEWCTGAELAFLDFECGGCNG